MQNQPENSSSNVVPLFGAKKSNASAKDSETKTEESKESFLDSIKKNFENDERLRKERLKANQSVLKSYRIKN